MEANKDTTWGSGISLIDNDCLNTSKYTGENRLGILLMKIRNKIQAEGESPVRKKIRYKSPTPPLNLSGRTDQTDYF